MGLPWPEQTLISGQALEGGLTKVAIAGVGQDFRGWAEVLSHLGPLSALQGHPVLTFEGMGHHKWHIWWPVQKQSNYI